MKETSTLFFLSPWKKTEHIEGTIQQLRLEASNAHILFEKKLELVAHRIDCDDILVKVFDADFEYAAVHLTWATKKHTDDYYPATDIYSNWEDFCKNRMELDHLEREE